MKLPILRNSAKPSLPAVFKRAAKRLQDHRHQSGGTRLGFIIDATSSRAHTWREAQSIQGRMFRALKGQTKLVLRLMHFGGNELTDHGWSANTKEIAARMATVGCIAGYTCYTPALEKFVKDGDRYQADYLPGAIIMVGDAFEEDFEAVCSLGHALARKNIKIFTFLEGDDPATRKLFEALAKVTDGKFAKFGADLPLSDLCEGVALIAGGGSSAAAKIKNENVKRLLLSGPSK